MIPLILNRRAKKDYSILTEYEAGIVLSGQEVKALRGKRASIAESYVKVMSGEVYLVNARIEQHTTTAHISYDPTRSRKLLLKKKQIQQLEEALSTKGLTAIPLAIGTTKNFIKVAIGVGKGKKQYERREELRRKDLDRETEKAMKFRS